MHTFQSGNCTILHNSDGSGVAQIVVETNSEDYRIITGQIESWVRKILRGKCNKMTLVNLTSKSSAQDVLRIFEIPLEESDERLVDSLLLQIAYTAQRNCDDLFAGSQKYAIYAYHADDPRYVPRLIFSASPETKIAQNSVGGGSVLTRELKLPCEVLVAFVSELLRAQRIAGLEKAGPCEILGMRTEKT